LTTIDKVLGGRRADIIKVDVEGLEPEFLPVLTKLWRVTGRP